MPTVDPDDVAAAILAVLKSRAARRSVPCWAAPAWSTTALVPERLHSLARRLLDDRRALTSLDTAARGVYIERVNRQALSHHTQHGDRGEPTS